MKTYPHLQKAPKNHYSVDFIAYIRKNNVVVKETAIWIVVENCKYHTRKRRHYTAFHKYHNFAHAYIDRNEIDELLNKFPDMIGYINPKVKRSVRRYHLHLIERPKYLQ